MKNTCHFAVAVTLCLSLSLFVRPAVAAPNSIDICTYEDPVVIDSGGFSDQVPPPEVNIFAVPVKFIALFLDLIRGQRGCFNETGYQRVIT